MANKKPASVETVNRLISDMHLTLVSSYKELIADLRMAEVLKRNDLHGLDAAEKEYIGNVLSVHANVCYCNLCLCAQMRASLKAKLDVEKQFTIRRGVGTLHEMYKYLFGFTPKKTLWQEVEDVLRSKYPVECQAVDDAATSFLQQYAQVEDGTLRDDTLTVKIFSHRAFVYVAKNFQLRITFFLGSHEFVKFYPQNAHLLICRRRQIHVSTRAKKFFFFVLVKIYSVARKIIFAQKFFGNPQQNFFTSIK